MKNHSHSLHILFPLGLLGAFAGLAILVLLLTAGVWQGSRDRSQAGYHSAAAASYLTEKLRQSDTAGAVSLGQLGEGDALILTTQTASGVYDTYLYCHDGSLRELMLNRQVQPDPALGRELLPLEELTIDPGPGGSLTITCDDTTIYCALRTEAAP